MSSVLASWPSGLEPGLPQPDYHKARIAPLTLVYGQQPPVTSGQRDIDVITETLSTCWLPPDPPPQPDLRRGHIAPLTLRYGDQPVLGSGQRDIDVFYASMIAWIPPDPQPQRDLKLTAPLSLTYGQQPPVTSGMRDIDLFNEAMSIAWLPPDPLPQPNLKRDHTAPLTLVYGDQPPRLSNSLRAILGNWPQDPAPQIQRPGTAAWNVPTIVVSQPPFVPLPQAIIASWQPIDCPQTPRKQIAPLTLAYGQQPPPYSSATISELVRLNEAWIPPPQQDRKLTAPLSLIYGDQPPVVSGQRDADVMNSTMVAWLPPDPLPQPNLKRDHTAPLTLVYGDQPPAVSSKLLSIVGAWNPDLQPAQPRPAVAAFSFVVTVPFVPLSQAIISSWQMEPSRYVQRPLTAPLSLVYGDQPPRYSIATTMELVKLNEAWIPPPPRDPKLTAPLALTYGDQPPPMVRRAEVHQAWAMQDGNVIGRPRPSIAWFTFFAIPTRFATLYAGNRVDELLKQPDSVDLIRGPDTTDLS